MTDRDLVLKGIGENKPNAKGSSIVVNIPTTKDENLVEKFSHWVSNVGGNCLLQNGRDLPQIIQREYPEVKSVFSCVEGVASHGIWPDQIKKPHDLNNISLAIIQGCFGVAENGAVWIEETNMGHRIIPFIAEHLVILLDRQSIVANMHAAYDKIVLTQVSYGTFISGPSKTADIEQVLVMGAQGPKSHLVILTD